MTDIPMAGLTGFRLYIALEAAATLILVGVAGLWPGPWDLVRGAGSLLAVLGLALTLLARHQLGPSFAVTPRARPLVTHGLYSRIRSPIYVFGTMTMLGLVMVLRVPGLWILLLVLVPVQIVRARREARVLEERFGDAYREYRKRTWF